MNNSDDEWKTVPSRKKQQKPSDKYKRTWTELIFLNDRARRLTQKT